jgi:hypothetical protein
MPWGPLYTDLPLITLPAGRSARVVDENAWTTLITNLGTWPADVNAGAHNLSNIGALAWKTGGGSLSGDTTIITGVAASGVSVRQTSGGGNLFLGWDNSRLVGRIGVYDTPTTAWKTLEIVGATKETLRLKNPLADDYLFAGWDQSGVRSFIGSFSTVNGWRPVRVAGIDGGALEVCNSSQDGVAFIGYHAASDSARLGSFNATWRPLIINEGGGLVQIGQSAWNGGHLVMGVYHFWVDGSGRLRIKSSAPASDTDGSVVGTQS